MHGQRHNLLLCQVLAMLLVYLHPVLLLALLGAVADQLALSTSLDGGPVFWLPPAIVHTVKTGFLTQRDVENIINLRCHFEC